MQLIQKFFTFCSLSFLALFKLPMIAYAVEIGDAFMVDDAGTKPVSGYAYKSFGEFMTAMIPNVMVVANLILFFLILFGGFMMIKNSGNAQKQAEASSIITSALIGFLVIFGAYWIMQILSTILGFNIIGGTS